LNLFEFDFESITDKTDNPFSITRTNQDLLNEAIERGYDCEDKAGNKFFIKLFYEGVKEWPEFKRNIDKDKSKVMLTYARQLCRSFEPKHEHKEYVCAMIFDDLFKL